MRWARPARSSARNVAALVAELHTGMGLPLAKVSEHLKTKFGLQVTPGGLVHLLHRTAAAAAPAYAALCEQVRHSPVVTPDETGWRVNAVRHWLWAYATPETTVYAICDGRGFADAAAVLGPRLRRRAGARRVGGLSRLQARAAPDVSGTPAATMQATAGGSSRQPLGRPSAGGPAGWPRPAGPLQRRRHQRTRSGVGPRPTRRPARPAD